jgi:hypothetical protein
MNAGTGERLSASPQPASASAPPVINATKAKTRPTRRFYRASPEIAWGCGRFAALRSSTIAETGRGTGFCTAPARLCRYLIAG